MLEIKLGVNSEVYYLFNKGWDQVYAYAKTYFPHLSLAPPAAAVVLVPSMTPW